MAARKNHFEFIKIMFVFFSCIVLLWIKHLVVSKKDPECI